MFTNFIGSSILSRKLYSKSAAIYNKNIGLKISNSVPKYYAVMLCGNVAGLPIHVFSFTAGMVLPRESTEPVEKNGVECVGEMTVRVLGTMQPLLAQGHVKSTEQLFFYKILSRNKLI